MINLLKCIVACLCASSLTACVINGQQSNHRYTTYHPYVYQETRFSPQSYDGTVRYSSFSSRAYREKNVPESYHIGPSRAPASHKILDKKGKYHSRRYS